MGAADGTSDATIPTLTLTGYVALDGLNAHAIDTETPANSTNVVTPFVLNANTLGGRSYAIVATYTNREDGAFLNSTSGAAVEDPETGSYPTLPTNVDGLVRRDWNDHYNAASADDAQDRMPDLYAHFQEGHRGTIDLVVVAGDAAPIDGTFDATATGATARVGDANARTVVINEVMWARDESEIGNVAATREQWIEIYNTKTTPVAFENIWFMLSNDHPAPANESTDRLSTNPSFTSVWDIDGKGQHGNPGADDGSGRIEFIAMARTNHANGWSAGHWAAEGDLYLPNFRGTPGRANAFAGLPGARTNPGATNPDNTLVVINEIGKSSSDNQDWIELKNLTGSDQSLKGWSLTITTGYGNETQIFDFADNDKVLANGHLLLLNSQPGGNKHIRGFDIRVAAVDQLFGIDENSHRYLVVDNKIQIPAGDQWLLILRSNNDDKFHQSSHHIKDVAGPGGGHSAFVVQDLNAAKPRMDKNGDGVADKGSIWQTRVWPLNGQNAGSKDNFLRHDKGDGDGSIATGGDNAVWTRNTGKDGFQHGAFGKAGYTGVGYDRSAEASAVNGGTPGFPNDTVKSKLADIGGSLIVSELMLNNDGGKSPQWIELKNTSTTHAINFHDPDGNGALKAWKIEFENHNSGSWQENDRPLNISFNLSDLFDNVPPEQTVLIVSTKARNAALSSDAHFPAHRVASIEEDKKAAFKLASKRDTFLNAEGGFTITIIDSAGQISDMVGNLDGKAFDTRAGIGLDDPFGWDWSTELAPDESRTSLIRLRNADGSPRAGTPVRPVEDDPTTADVDESVAADMMRGSVLPLGTSIRGNGVVNSMDAEGNAVMLPGQYAGAAWVHAVDTDGDALKQITYYGDADDYGTPLYSTGTALPVSLSFFRPTLEEGKVVIRWTTESELDNAGFNILRSDSRNGEFTKVNEQLIEGKGTTAERSTYKWVDASAKPGAVYYYQIEDVSFAGERNTLTTTKLKGLISAKNKLTTRWGELKSQN